MASSEDIQCRWCIWFEHGTAAVTVSRCLHGAPQTGVSRPVVEYYHRCHQFERNDRFEADCPVERIQGATGAMLDKLCEENARLSATVALLVEKLSKP